jgi:hypothetical protein
MRNLALALLFAFLVAFPKGGFKLGPVPVTFGYLLLGFICLAAAFRNLAAGCYRTIPSRSAFAFAATLPLQAVALLLAVEVPSAEPALTLAFIVSFVLLPLAFLFVLTPQINGVDPRRFDAYLRRCVSFVALYGIVLFFYRIAMGHFIEIPYLTVNVADVGNLASGKDIDRGNGIFKLISTYNNGNIYGVCVLMLLPLYDLVQRSLLWRLVVRLSLLLTLSRTVWFGWAAYEVVAALYLRKLRASTLITVVVSLAVATAGVLYVMQRVHLDIGFLFDATLGGRAEILRTTQPHFVPGVIVFPSEVTYVTVLDAFGVAGLVCFLIAMLAPVGIVAARPLRRGSHPRALITGMGMLLICGFSDGPILLIPVMAFYWALAALALSSIDWSRGTAPLTVPAGRARVASERSGRHRAIPHDPRTARPPDGSPAPAAMRAAGAGDSG